MNIRMSMMTRKFVISALLIAAICAGIVFGIKKVRSHFAAKRALTQTAAPADIKQKAVTLNKGGPDKASVVKGPPEKKAPAPNKDVAAKENPAAKPTGVIPSEPALPKEAAIELAKLRARLDALEALTLSGAVPAKIAAHLPAVSDYRGHGALVLAMFDAVGPYRKNGLFETYGASLREHRTGPIQVGEADLEITHDEAWAIWSPDYSPASDATHLEIVFAAAPASGKLTIGFVLDDGQAESFIVELGPSASKPTGLLPPLLPEEFVATANNAGKGTTLHLKANKLVTALPANVMLKLRDGGDHQIAQWFVKVEGGAGTTLRFKTLALIRPSSAVTNAGVTLSGRAPNSELPPTTEIELLTEAGAIIKQPLGLDGTFSFTGVDPERPVSLRVRHPQLLHFATLGRWFVPSYSRNDISIDFKPHYVNNDGHAPEPAKAKFIGARVPSTVSAHYEPHSRQHWPGGGKIQEYDSTTFANNFGYVDRDRFFDNPDNCVRLASTGGSDMVALQVRPFEKFNILLEDSLGVAIGRCVEVISAATDNGDIGTNYPRIRDYTSKFNVAHTLVSAMAGLIYQVNPQMLRDGLGIDPDNSALPNFYYDKSGQFSFRPASPVFAVFRTKPTLPEYAKGIPFGQTLSVPFDVMPAPGKEAFRYWTDIVSYIEKQHPGQKLIFHSGVDQAQCRMNCETKVTLEGGATVPAGPKIFTKNLSEYCAKNSYKCINPEFSDAYQESPNLLTFEFDGHYSPLGHQWLAQQLTAPLAGILSGGVK